MAEQNDDWEVHLCSRAEVQHLIDDLRDHLDGEESLAGEIDRVGQAQDDVYEQLRQEWLRSRPFIVRLEEGLEATENELGLDDHLLEEAKEHVEQLICSVSSRLDSLMGDHLVNSGSWRRQCLHLLAVLMQLRQETLVDPFVAKIDQLCVDIMDLLGTRNPRWTDLSGSEARIVVHVINTLANVPEFVRNILTDTLMN